MGCPCADSEPFTFTAALQTHFAVHNLAMHARHVRALGLGGKWIFDYAPDLMHPRLDIEKEDYVTFGGDACMTLFSGRMRLGECGSLLRRNGS